MITAICDICGVDYSKDWLSGRMEDNIDTCRNCSLKISNFESGQLYKDTKEFKRRQLKGFIETLKAEMGTGVLPVRPTGFVPFKSPFDDPQLTNQGLGLVNQYKPIEDSPEEKIKAAKLYADKLNEMLTIENNLKADQCNDLICHCKINRYK